MDFIKKLTIETADYPNNAIRICRLKPGDEFYISYKGIDFKPGQRYYDYPAIIREVVYKPKPWYLFWKKKEIYGYFIKYTGEDINKED